MQPHTTFRDFSLRLAAALLIIPAMPLFSQTAQDAPWTGQAQCQLTVQSQGYAHQEIQTWTITGAAPATGSMPVYPATWSVISQGATQRVQGPQTLMARWNANVPAISAPLAIFIRASDNLLVIKSYHAQLHAPGGLTGARQISTAGASPTQSAMALDVYEWQFPAIEDSPTSTNVSGTGTVIVAGSFMPMQSATASGTATCKWQFSKGAIPSTPPAPATAATNLPSAAGLKAAGGMTEISPGALPPAPPPPPGNQSSDAGQGNLSPTAAVTKEPLQTVVPGTSQVSKLLQPLPAPGGFTAQPLGLGAVQFKWQAVSGASKYHLAGTGVAADGIYVTAPATNVTIENTPPGPGEWQIASVGLNNSWDPKQTATATAMVRYVPTHSPQWLSKANGAGNPAPTLAHYLSLCNQCIPGANFKDVMQNLGLRLDTMAVFPDVGDGCGAQPWCGGWGGPWVDDQAARYTNVTEFENSARVTGCWTIGAPNGRIICYTKTSDHGLQVIVRQTDDSWFLSFTGDPNAEVLDWVTYDSGQIDRTPLGQRFTSAYTLSTGVNLDSEGTKFPPHACLACHGGKFTASGVTGATLLPLDPGLIKPTTFTIDGTDYYYDAGNVRKVNQAVISASPSAAVARYLTGLYGIDPHVASSTGDPNYVPTGWKQQPEVYNNVVKPYCMMCHLATPSNLDFTMPANFNQNKDLVYTAICSARSMPHAEAPFKTFWTKDTGPVFLPGYVAALLGHQNCP